MWKWIRVRRPRKRGVRATAQYQAHKEAARSFVHARLEVLNAQYGFVYGKVAIRDQKSRWGSCSSKKNLNFNYRILFLPSALADYIIVHELCHLGEFNHSPAFWRLVARVIPDHVSLRRQLATVRMRTLKARPIPEVPCV